MLRVLHFSDVHVEAPLREVPLREMASKKLVGWALLRAWRGRKFREGPRKLRAMAAFMEELRPDVVICTGDLTALGTEPELDRARRALEPFTRAPHGLVTVPGNHDIYLPGAVDDRRFERSFGDVLGSDLPALCVDGHWPLVRLIGEEMAVVALNSARPNPQPWRSSGLIPAAQLEALGRVLAHPRLRHRFVVVATHYALRLADGRPDSLRHGLVNAAELVRACGPIERGALLHGHVHHCYHVRIPGLRAPVFGAGSCTEQGREGLWLLELEGAGGRATPGYWTGERFALTEAAFVPL